MSFINPRHTPLYDEEETLTNAEASFVQDLSAAASDDATNVPIIFTGTSTPATTPVVAGDIFVDVVNDVIYIATGTSSSADWTALAGATGIVWSEVTTTSQSASVNNAYIVNNAGQVTVTLPDTASVGDIVRIVGKGSGGWKIAQNASEVINFGSSATTTGTGGYLESTNRYDAVELVCITANTTWNVISSQGNITVN